MNFPTNQTPIDLLILSPHLDDAVLSCGATIFERVQAGERVVVLTIMAGDPPPGDISPYAQSLEARWELVQEAVSRRRAEDIAACDYLGAEWLHWEIPDCIYRRDVATGQTFYNSNEELFGAVHPAEYPLRDDLAKRFEALPVAGEIYVPLGIGGHVDHQLTRVAAERLKAPIVYYEDYPYAQSPGALEKCIDRHDPRWISMTRPVSAQAISEKTAAIAKYVSQISTFFTDSDDLAKKVRDFSTQVGGERVWRWGE